mmetsp:Transcript_17714/g.57556  ORF Transcript_17714/g.57556 Transcript_17714/m.57556 type:complete len:234 (+) Transcript_17714:788-1489(+)
MIARPSMSRNEWKATEIGAFEVGNVALFSRPDRDRAGRQERDVEPELPEVRAAVAAEAADVVASAAARHAGRRRQEPERAVVDEVQQRRRAERLRVVPARRVAYFAFPRRRRVVPRDERAQEQVEAEHAREVARAVEALEGVQRVAAPRADERVLVVDVEAPVAPPVVLAAEPDDAAQREALLERALVVVRRRLGVAQVVAVAAGVDEGHHGRRRELQRARAASRRPASRRPG